MKKAGELVGRLVYGIVIVTLTSTTPGWATGGADNTTGSGATTAMNDYQFAGAATLTICGQEKTADLLVTVLEPPVVDGEGVHHVKASHEFTFADGSCITTLDEETATPTDTPGLYTLVASMDIVSGTGVYEGVTGQLEANGTMNFVAEPPAATFDLAGSVIQNTMGSGTTTAINDYQFAGTAMLLIQGQERPADLLVTVLEPPVVDGEGVHHVVAMHEFTFADGSSLTTSDQELAAPTTTPGLYALMASMQIVSGTGMYERVVGRLEATGTMDFAAEPPTAQFDLAGGISFCGDGNHPYPMGDLNEDCRVNMLDFTMMCEHWLEDNGPFQGQ